MAAGDESTEAQGSEAQTASVCRGRGRIRGRGRGVAAALVAADGAGHQPQDAKAEGLQQPGVGRRSSRPKRQAQDNLYADTLDVVDDPDDDSDRDSGSEVSSEEAPGSDDPEMDSHSGTIPEQQHSNLSRPRTRA